MSNNTENVNKKLIALKNNFVQTKLPSRVHEIVSLLQRILESDIDKALLKKLLEESHRLKGAAAVYQLKSLAALMEKIEGTASDKIRQCTVLPEDEKSQWQAYIGELRHSCGGTCIEESMEPESLMPVSTWESGFYYRTGPENMASSETEPTHKIVFVIEPDNTVAKDLIKQFSLYGYDAEIVENIEDLIFSVKHLRDEVIVIIDTVFLENDKMHLSSLTALKASKRNVVLAFVSRHGDFELRLKAVKAGADAYFVFPLDVGESIDKLNSLTTRNNPYHILIVDDDPHQVACYAHLLQQRNMITSVVSKPMEVVRQIILTKPELIMMDLNMPNCNGWELAKVIRQQEAFVSIPIVFLSGEKDVEKRYEALRNGGDDFISKDTPDFELIESICIRAERYRTLRFYMERDSLTGLLNHTRLIEQLTAEINKAKRMKRPFSFAMIDLDHFKDVNDNYGHLIGDKVLKRLARLMKERLRSSDIIGRYGGEEFAVILPDTGANAAYNVIEEIRIKFAEMSHTAPAESFKVSLSSGIATYIADDSSAGDGEGGEKAKELAIRITFAADKTLYKAKEQGRNRIVKVDVYDQANG